VLSHDKTLLGWLDDPRANRGMHFAKPGDDWDFWPHTRLADQVLTFAAACGERGVGHGDVIMVIKRCSPGFVSALFGAMAAGATACSVAPPFAYHGAENYERHLAHVLTVARPALIVADEDALDRVSAVTRGLGLVAPVSFAELTAGIDPLPGPRSLAGPALLQFTSGSGGASRGVLVPAAALEANLAAMRRWMRWDTGTSLANWLPVHHDMGLTGSLINVVVAGTDSWMLQPGDFIRDPLRYLRCLSERAIRLSPMPNFGLAYILRRVRPEHLAGLSFESLRAIIIGAERIDPAVLTAFAALLGPFGLDRRVLVPAYGSAEATLAVTGLPVGEGWTIAQPESAAETATPLVGCGRPLQGTAVRVLDERGDPVPDGVIGEIVVSGTSLAAGYTGAADTASGTKFGDGVLHSGDAGFLRDGQLFVIGRIGDGLKVRGRMVFAESLEAKMREFGIPERRAAVLLGIRDGRATAAVVLEVPKPEWSEIARRVLAEHLDDADLLAVTVPRGGLAVTSSGKPRRRVLWKALCDGTLPGQIGSLAIERVPELVGEH